MQNNPACNAGIVVVLKYNPDFLEGLNCSTPRPGSGLIFCETYKPGISSRAIEEFKPSTSSGLLLFI
jgi:hypothetical protein